MWWKLLLLTLYLAVLFILSRILEVVAYYEGGYISSHLLDPVALSVKRLKILLDQRGVSYAGVVEKQELTELVEATGEVTEGELEAASLTEETSTSTNFTCGTHFYEEVEDTKDSVWVVQVIMHKDKPFMRQDDWKAFIKKVSRFGVRTGIFDCSLDWRLCEKKQWYTQPLRPRLIMALPHTYRAKDNVVIKSFTESTKTQKVFDWVNLNLASRIKNISTLDQLRHKWFTYEKVKEQSKLKVVLFSKLKIPPMFYSVLSVKFSGRVNFGTIDIGTETGEKIAKELGINKFPLYLILTPEKNYTFGIGQGEYLNYHSMGLFLKTLHPEVNDTFLLSLVVMNIICWFELFISPGNLFKRLGSFLWHLGKWNFLLILLWLPILGLFQLPYMDMVLDYALTLLRTLGTTRVASVIREDFIWYSSVNCSFLIITFLLFASIVGMLHYLYKGPDDEPAEQNNNNTDTWWNFQWDMYMSYFFRPMATLTRPMSPQDLDLEVGMELLIERLAVPNFWLRPMISSQYINDLPVWKYTGPSIDSDIGSDTDAMSMVSDGEDAGSGIDSAANGESDNRPYMFICEKCRALQSKKTEQELEQERIESESACAKYLMDGDYKCACQCNSGHDHGTTRRSPKKERYKNGSRNSSKQSGSKAKTEEEEEAEPTFQMPPGILPTTECAICLESYKYGVNLCGLPCGHCFHEYCIMGWLTRDNHCCPVCRWPPYKAKPCSIHLHAE